MSLFDAFQEVPPENVILDGEAFSQAAPAAVQNPALAAAFNNGAPALKNVPLAAGFDNTPPAMENPSLAAAFDATPPQSK